MKAFIASLVACIVIAVIAAFVLEASNRTTAQLYQSPTGDVRL